MSPCWDLIPGARTSARAQGSGDRGPTDVAERQRRGRAPLATDKAEMTQLERSGRPRKVKIRGEE